MKALLSKTIGAPESLVVGHVSDPVPGDDEILITVKACGVNFPDTLIIEDKYQFKPERPFSPGGEVAGIVAEVGQNISGIRPGDRVIGWCTWGGMAEKVVVTPEQAGVPGWRGRCNLRCGRWRLRGSRPAWHRMGRPLSRSGISGRRPATSFEPRAAQVLPDRGRFLGPSIIGTPWV